MKTKAGSTRKKYFDEYFGNDISNFIHISMKKSIKNSIKILS